MVQLLKNVFINKLFSSGLISIVIKAIGVLSSLAVSIILGNHLGAEQLGVISLSNKLIAIGIVVGAFGFDTYLIKLFATKSISDSNSISINTGVVMSGVFSLLIILLSIVFARELSTLFFDGPEYSKELAVIALGLIPNSIVRVLSAALNGKGFVWHSVMLNETLMAFMVSVLLVLGFYAFKVQLSLLDICWIYTTVRFSVFTVCYLMVYRLVKIRLNLLKFKLREFKETSNMYLVGLISLFNSSFDLIIISVLLSNYELGIYSVVARIALSLIIILQVANTVLKPRFAELYHQYKVEELNRLLSNTIKFLAAITIPLYIMIVISGKTLLGFWGPEFKEAYNILLIVCFGQMVNAITGPVGSILIMCGREKELKYLMLGMFIFSIVVIPLIIMSYELIGAAIAFSSILIIQNIVILIMTRHYLSNSIDKYN